MSQIIYVFFNLIKPNFEQYPIQKKNFTIVPKMWVIKPN